MRPLGFLLAILTGSTVALSVGLFLTWVVILHHNTHTHPFLDATPGNDIPIVGPPPEDLAAVRTSYLEIQLTATNSRGLSIITQ